MDASARKAVIAPLDDENESNYRLEGDALEFYRKETCINDDKQLKEHIFAVQKKAFDVSGLFGVRERPRSTHLAQIFKYTCIRVFDFLRQADPSTPRSSWNMLTVRID